MGVCHIGYQLRIQAILGAPPGDIPKRGCRRALEDDEDEKHQARGDGEGHGHPGDVDVDFLDGDAEEEDADGDFEDGGARDVAEFADPPVLRCG